MSKLYTEQEVREIAETVAQGVETSGTIPGKVMDTALELGKTVADETAENARRIAAGRLYDNVEALISNLILDRMKWWQKLTISSKNKDLMILAGTYAVIHFIRTGGFGVTNYRIDHEMLRLLSSECNARIMSKVLGGFDTNIAQALFSAPEITEVA